MANDSEKVDLKAFPSKADAKRIDAYSKYDLLLEGDHFSAFNMVVENDLNKKWGHLRYVAANFAGLISKVMADMLFGEAAKFKFNNEENQRFADAVAYENKLHVQNYESALTNSARGDAVYKLRIGKRHPSDSRMSLIIEDISPYIYFPVVDEGNVRAIPDREELAWIVRIGSKYYVRKEVHTPGLITNEIYEYDKSARKILGQLPWASVYPDIPEQQPTKINRNLIVHVPNWRIGSRYFGISDYTDLEPLFFALNNRLTKNDNILDKHSDPILAVPEGVLDENGEVRKEYIGVYEVPSGTGQGGLTKPEYIIWDANLEAAFKEIDKLVDLMFMISEISPATMGMDKDGSPASGRALKLKLLRTIAKKRRKQLYYDQALKEVMTIAQELAKAWGISAYGMDAKEVKAPSTVETPEIEFGDGLINDTREMAEEEQIRINSGTTSTKDAIMRLDGVDEETAKKKVKEINEESGLELPLTNEVKNPNDKQPANDGKTPPPAEG